MPGQPAREQIIYAMEQASEFGLSPTKSSQMESIWLIIEVSQWSANDPIAYAQLIVSNFGRSDRDALWM